MLDHHYDHAQHLYDYLDRDASSLTTCHGVQVVRAIMWPDSHQYRYVTASDDAIVSLWYGPAPDAGAEQQEGDGITRGKKRQRRT